jgi:tetratricopeptide (TPR) repeat protein
MRSASAWQALLLSLSIVAAAATAQTRSGAVPAPQGIAIDPGAGNTPTAVTQASDPSSADPGTIDPNAAAAGSTASGPSGPGPADPSADPAAGNPAGSAPAPDLLSKYDKGPGSNPPWWSKLKGLFGAGGTPPKQAAKAYGHGDYDGALQKYAEAQLDHPGSQALAYDMGNAQYRKKRYDDAIVSYKKALQGSDAALAASAYYNLGNSHFRKGEFAIQSGKQEGIEDYREAMANYKKSLEIRPENRDAKRNIEVVQARIKELLDRQKQKQDQKQQGNPQKPPEPSEEAKRVLARAMHLTQERRYAEAKTLLEDIIQKDKTAASFQPYVQRLDDVLKILRGETPTPPKAQDPRASQSGVGVI